MGWFLSWIQAKSDRLFFWKLYPQNIDKTWIHICSVTKCCMLSIENSLRRSLTSCTMWSRTWFVLLFKREKITYIKNIFTCLFVWILQFMNPSDGLIHSYYALVFKTRLCWSIRNKLFKWLQSYMHLHGKQEQFLNLVLHLSYCF